jgi:hypothetical protein
MRTAEAIRRCEFPARYRNGFAGGSRSQLFDRRDLGHARPGLDRVMAAGRQPLAEKGIPPAGIPPGPEA